ncbi:SEC10/PgrA surface exclusion domain-containing protein [Streptococcus suis]|uniref:SEC10/PgrA surface exclusion domain-containing protein n=1 Tax=Streptococcus suis TaxID=1307 RepID=UPI00300F7F2C
MNKKTLKTLATGAAITLATVGASNVSANTQYGIQLNRVTGEWQTVNNATGEIVKSVPNETYSSYEEAEASLMASTVETPVATETPATETTAVEAPKTAAEVKPALDAQQAVVDATAQNATNAQSDADAAGQAVATAQTDVDTATQAVKDAEANTVNATPENIAANQADQTANLADQAANATETDEVNAEIASQTQTVADAQTAVDTAQAEKDQADATVTAKEADVKAAQDALSGTGLAEAQATLDQATADVKTAQDNVTTATTAVDTAKKADADRQTKIDAATTDVAVKTDAVNTAKAKLTTAQDTVKTTTEAVSKATDAVKSATDAMTDVDTVTFTGTKQDVDNFKESLDMWKQNKTDQLWKNTLIGNGVKMTQGFNTTISSADKNEIVNINALTDEQLQELALYNLQVVNAVRQLFGAQPLTLNAGSLKAANDQAKKYIARNESIQSAGHVSGGDYSAENVSNLRDVTTMYDLKYEIYDAVKVMAFADAPSSWGHLYNTLMGRELGVAFATFAGQPHLINVFGVYTGTPIINPNDPATLQANLTQAQAALTAAQTASDEAKAKLTQASSDYATALEAKTQAEKVLADATATPLQTQVAENNLRLATIALQNAEARKADAQKAVDNFSADLATKKVALDTAKAELATAQATANSKAEALKTAQANLASQQATLDSLNKERNALLAEKDRLVEEAKALAEELNGYLNAPAILAEAQTTLTAKQAALDEAQAKAETAQAKLETVTAKLNEEKAKLAELQAEYATVKELEDKAKDNIIATLPDGTIVAVPKTAPTADAKPAVDVDLVKDAVAKGQDVKVVDGKVVVAETTAGVTVTPQGITYSRVERAKALPNTGEQTSLLALAGVTALSSLGLAGARRKRK